MPRSSPRPQFQGPSLSPDQARSDLERSLARAKKLLQEHPLTKQRYDAWNGNAWEILKAAVGENHEHLHGFVGQQRVTIGQESEYYLEQERREFLTEKVAFLEAVIEEFPAVGIQTQGIGSDFFSDLDTDIRRVSKQLFDNQHFPDSVLAAFRELNDQVKQEYKKRTNTELDGAPLMRKAFSPNDPVFVLDDLSTESGKNIQQGFMDLFAGSMIGIRNPLAHKNLPVNADAAKHLLYLASFLMKTFKDWE